MPRHGANPQPPMPTRILPMSGPASLYGGHRFTTKRCAAKEKGAALRLAATTAPDPRIVDHHTFRIDRQLGGEAAGDAAIAEPSRRQGGIEPCIFLIERRDRQPRGPDRSEPDHRRPLPRQCK